MRECLAQGCLPNGLGGANVQDLAGKDLNNSPDLKYVIGLDYGTPINDSIDGFVRVNFQWQDEVNFSLLADPSTVHGSYGILNISAGIESPDGRYTFTAFVNNVLDEFYASNFANLSNLYGDKVITQVVPRNAERHAGIRVKFNF